MAIDKYFLKSAVRTLRRIEKAERITVATLGYPDLMCIRNRLTKCGYQP